MMLSLQTIQESPSLPHSKTDVATEDVSLVHSLRDLVADLQESVEDLKRALAQSAQPAKASYTVDEAAAAWEKTPYTVRKWCRERRINAKKRQERRGPHQIWSIPAAEISRYRNEGLLPPDPARND